MNASEALKQLSSTETELVGNDPLGLGGAPSVYFIESGSVALYYAEMRDGVQVGPRRFLQRIGSGQALLSIPPEPFERLGFFVVPVREVRLRIVALSGLWADAQARAVLNAEAMVEGWVALLCSLLADRSAPKLVTRVSEGGNIVLEPGQALRADHKCVVWCRALEGAVLVQGLDDTQLGEGDGVLPITTSVWLSTPVSSGDEGNARLALGATAEMGPGELESGLRRLAGLVFDRLREIEERETAQELGRLSERERILERKTHAALEELASVFESRQTTIQRETPLLTAITAVGEQIGATIRAPGKSEGSGASVDLIDAIARASRVRYRRVRLTGKWWKRDAGPLLTWTNDEERRPVALIPDKKLRYEVFDPERGTRDRLNQQVSRGLSNEAVTFYRPLPEGKLGLPELLKFTLRPYVRELKLIITAGVIATLLGMLVPQGTALLMDYAIPDADQRLLLEIGAGLLAAALGQTLFFLAQGIVLARLGLQTESHGQAAVWDRLLRLRPSFFRGFSSGDLQSRVMAVSNIGRQLSGVTLSTLFSGFLAFLNLGLLYYYSPMLSGLAILIGAVLMVFTIVMGVFIRRNLRVLLEIQGEFFGMVIQLISAVAKLRVAGAEGRAFTHWVQRYSSQVRLSSNIQKLKDFVGVFHSILPTLSTALLYLFSYEMLLEARQPGQTSGLGLGSFLAFNVAFGTFLGGVLSLSQTAVGIQNLFVQAKRVQPILEAEPEIDEEKRDPGELTGRLAMDSVSFSYDSEGPRILDSVTMNAEPGEFVAIVGPSGSGKSTLFRMLLGFEAPQEGVVSFDGQDLASLDVLAVRRQLGVVLQGGRLDAGSVFDNIACGNVLTLDEAWAAAGDAGFADEVREMPMGMHTIVSVGGGNLSGGQRQRLLIARALAHRPKILIFDEATSALDNRTQAIVSESLERLKVTRIVVAHRLSTIRQADRIYVVEAGRIVQNGAFEELMAQSGGLFSRMMSRQLA